MSHDALAGSVRLLEPSTLELADGAWRLLGGGGGPGYDVLEASPGR